ncbi:hypothetical protein D3C87_1072620 [compost metagenome]
MAHVRHEVGLDLVGVPELVVGEAQLLVGHHELFVGEHELLVGPVQFLGPRLDLGVQVVDVLLLQAHEATLRADVEADHGPSREPSLSIQEGDGHQAVVAILVASEFDFHRQAVLRVRHRVQQLQLDLGGVGKKPLHALPDRK